MKTATEKTKKFALDLFLEAVKFFIFAVTGYLALKGFSLGMTWLVNDAGEIGLRVATVIIALLFAFLGSGIWKYISFVLIKLSGRWQ